MPLNTKEPPKIDVNGEDIKCTSSFTYIGSTVTPEGAADKDIRCRLGKARGQIRKNTKIGLNNSGYYQFCYVEQNV